MGRPSPALACITLVQVICSLSIIAITSNRITHPGFGVQKRCYLSSDPFNTSPCSFAYAAAGVSLATAVLAGCLRCCSLDCCGLGPIQSVILAGTNCIWWLVAAAILTATAVSADAAELPASGARHMILAAAWCAAAAELVHSCVACLVVGNNVCNILFCIDDVPGGQDSCCGGNCCSCCCRGRRRHHGMQQPLLPAAAAAAAAAAATSAALHRPWWQRLQQWPAAASPQQAATVVTVQSGGMGGYMPPPPTPGQPYIVPTGPAAWTAAPFAAGSALPAASGHATAGAGAAGSFGGFATAPAAAAAGTPAFGSGLGADGPRLAAVQQQQGQPYAAPVVLPQMDAGADLYPNIPKQ